MTGLPGGQVDPAVEDRLVGAGRLAIDVAPLVERQGELDGRVAGELAVGVAVAAVDRQQGPVLIVPAQPDVADAAVDLGLDIDGEHGLAGLGPLVGDPEPLDVLAGRLLAARVLRQDIAHRHEVGDQDADRPVPPGQLGGQQVGDARVVLERLPGGRSVNQSSRRPTARPPTIARKCERLCGRSPSLGRTLECSPTVGK